MRDEGKKRKPGGNLEKPEGLQANSSQKNVKSLLWIGFYKLIIGLAFLIF